VLSWLPNGPHAIAVWFALNYIGAVYVPVNVSYRGRLLAHVIKNSGARLMIADARLASGSVKWIRPRSIRWWPYRGASAGPEGHSRPCRRGAFIRTSEPAGSAASHHALGHARGHLYIWYNGPLRACCRPIAISRHDGSDRYRDLGRSPRSSTATVPRRRTGGVVSYADMWRVVALVEAFDTQTFWDTVRKTGVTTMTLLAP